MLAMSATPDSPAKRAPSFERLLRAMNDPTDEHIADAFADDATLDRHSGTDPDTDQPGALRETFRGRAAIYQWLATTPKKFSFGLRGEPYAAPAEPTEENDDDDAAAEPDLVDEWRHEYAIFGPDSFENRGIWRGRFDDEGRLLWLSHRPFALRQ